MIKITITKMVNSAFLILNVLLLCIIAVFATIVHLEILKQCVIM